VESRTDKGSQVSFSMTVSYKPQSLATRAPEAPTPATAETPDGVDSSGAETGAETGGAAVESEVAS
jgi:hypothetical protein